jgi:WhiB family transcriptional regulator, redox-sensing transcriptional regulator
VTSIRPDGGMSVTIPDWTGAACVGSSDLFFGPWSETAFDRKHREAQAIAICRHCPLRPACGQFAVVNHIPYGVWGGLGEVERASMRRNWLRRQHAAAERRAS